MGMSRQGITLAMEVQAVNTHRATKHFILAANAGDDKALGMVKQGFMGGIFGKDEYVQTRYGRGIPKE